MQTTIILPECFFEFQAHEAEKVPVQTSIGMWEEQMRHQEACQEYSTSASRPDGHFDEEKNFQLPDRMTK